MKNRTRFTQLALAAGIAAALAAPASIQASPAQQNSNLTAATSLLPEDYTMLADVLITAPAKDLGSGYTMMIGTRIDAAALGSLDAKYTLNAGVNKPPVATLGADGTRTTPNTMASGGFGYGKVEVMVAPGDGTDKTPIKTDIAKGMTNGAANSGSGVIGHQVPFVGENGVTNATADLVSKLARVAHGLEPVPANTSKATHGATASGGTVRL